MHTEGAAQEVKGDAQKTVQVSRDCSSAPNALRGSLSAQFRSLFGDTGSKAVEAMLVGAGSATSSSSTARANGGAQLEAPRGAAPAITRNDSLC
jgi:hypothetical protein